MARPLPPLDLLVGFEVAARQLSFSKAGEELFLTQSAISRQVKKLEEYLGIDLFERQHRALVLTDQGQLLYEVTTNLLRGLTDTVECLRNQPEQRGLKISTTTSFAALWLVPRLARFNAICPEIPVQLSAENKTLDLAQSEIDLAIRYCAPDQAPESAIACLAHEEVFPVCSPALLRRNGRGFAAIDDLRHHTLLHLEDTRDAWPWLQWRSWLEKFGNSAFMPVAGFTFSHFDQMIQACCMGHGVALGSAPLVNSLLKDGMLVAPYEQRLASPRSFFVLRGRRRSADIDAFIEWLKAEAAEK